MVLNVNTNRGWGRRNGGERNGMVEVFSMNYFEEEKKTSDIGAVVMKIGSAKGLFCEADFNKN